MQERNVFGMGGVGGMLIATILLLSILAILTFFGIKAQKEVADKPYSIENISSIKKISKDNAKHVKIKE